jgi:hypothetical protein
MTALESSDAFIPLPRMAEMSDIAATPQIDAPQDGHVPDEKVESQYLTRCRQPHGYLASRRPGRTKDLREDFETRFGEQLLLPKAPSEFPPPVGSEPIPVPKPPKEYETPPRIPSHGPQELPPDYQVPPPATRRPPSHRWNSRWPV